MKEDELKKIYADWQTTETTNGLAHQCQCCNVVDYIPKLIAEVRWLSACWHGALDRETKLMMVIERLV